MIQKWWVWRIIHKYRSAVKTDDVFSVILKRVFHVVVDRVNWLRYARKFRVTGCTRHRFRVAHFFVQPALHQFSHIKFRGDNSRNNEGCTPGGTPWVYWIPHRIRAQNEVFRKSLLLRREKPAESRLQARKDLLAEGLSSSKLVEWEKDAFLKEVKAGTRAAGKNSTGTPGPEPDGYINTLA